MTDNKFPFWLLAAVAIIAFAALLESLKTRSALAAALTEKAISTMKRGIQE